MSPKFKCRLLTEQLRYLYKLETHRACTVYFKSKSNIENPQPILWYSSVTPPTKMPSIDPLVTFQTSFTQGDYMVRQQNLLLTLLLITTVSFLSISNQLFALQESATAPSTESNAENNVIQLLEEIDAYAQKVQKDWKVPGLAIGIVKNDKVIYSKGFGVCELGKEAKVDGDTLFAIASNSKAFTCAAICMLVDEG